MDDNKKIIVEERKPNIHKYRDLAFTIFLVAAAIIMFYFIVFRFSSVTAFLGGIIKVISPIIVGFAFAYVLNPVVMLLEGKFMDLNTWNNNRKAKKAENNKEQKPAKEKKKKEAKVLESDDNADITNQNSILSPERRTCRKLAILVTVVGTIGVVTLLMMSIVPAFARSISALAEKFPEYYNQVHDFGVRYIERHKWISKNIPNINEIIEKINIRELIDTYLDSVVTAAYNSVLGVFKVIYNVVIGLIVSMYLLGGKERYIAQIKKILYAFNKKEKMDQFLENMRKTNQIFRSAILGKMLDSIIIGCICFIGMSIIGLFGFEAIEANRVLISVIVGVTNVIPFFGPYIGAIPSIILLLCIQPISALAFAIFILVLQQFDMNFLDPRVVGRSVGLSPFYVLCACLTAAGLFGVLGLIVASPTCAVVYGVIKSITEEKLSEKDMSIDTQDYSSAKDKDN